MKGVATAIQSQAAEANWTGQCHPGQETKTHRNLILIVLLRNMHLGFFYLNFCGIRAVHISPVELGRFPCLCVSFKDSIHMKKSNVQAYEKDMPLQRALATRLDLSITQN